MTKTLVIGANGQIDRRFCQQAADNGDSVRAMIRDESRRAFFEGAPCRAGRPFHPAR